MNVSDITKKMDIIILTNFRRAFARENPGDDPPKWPKKLVCAAGKMACFGWPADSELEAPSGHALKHVAARPHAVYALTYDMAMGWHGYLQRWSAWVCLGRSPTSTSPFCVVGTHHALPQAAVHAILFPHARTTSQDYR